MYMYTTSKEKCGERKQQQQQQQYTRQTVSFFRLHLIVSTLSMIQTTTRFVIVHSSAEHNRTQQNTAEQKQIIRKENQYIDKYG